MRLVVCAWLCSFVLKPSRNLQQASEYPIIHSIRFCQNYALYPFLTGAPQLMVTLLLSFVLEMFCSPDIRLFYLTTANQGETMLVHTRELDSENLCHLLNGRHFDFRYPDTYDFLGTQSCPDNRGTTVP